MKVVLICPAERPGLGALSESAPLVTLPMLGKTLVEHWLDHLVKQGAREVCLLASDRPEEVRRITGDGSRWGLRAQVRPEVRELSLQEARTKCRPEPGGKESRDLLLMDHFPGIPALPLFTSYAGWFAAVQSLLLRRQVPNLIGLKEIKPGVWAGCRSHIAPDAQLHAPCWIGDHAWIGSKAILGPGAVVEQRAFVAAGAEIVRSQIAPETYVGEFTFVNHSLAFGKTLVNWRMNSCLRVPDPFLLCGLREPHVLFKDMTWPRQVASLLVLGLTLPLGALALLKSKIEEVPALRRLVLRGEG